MLAHPARLTLLLLFIAILIALGSWLLPQSPELQKNARASKPVAIAKPTRQQKREAFKRDLRQIGGDSFPVPKVKTDKIIREPPVSPSKTERKNLVRKPARTFALKRPVILDINTIKSGDTTILIAGIEALPLDKTCLSGPKKGPCGRMARTALRALVRGRTLTCQNPENPAEGGAITTSCSVGKTDIGQWLVQQGWTRSSIGQ